MTRIQAISRGVACGLLLLASPALAQPTAASAALYALEQSRIAAINSQNAAGLQGTLAPDYLHVHATGKVDNGPDFVKNTVANARITSRGPLTIRVYGDTAVMTGAQINQQPVVVNGQTPAPALLVVTQVAHRDATGWHYVSFQATPVGVASVNAKDFNGYPATPARTLTADQQAVIALEEKRAASIANKDFAGLTSVLAEDYVHIYGGGPVSDRGGYIKAVTAAPRVPVRGVLTARVYGDIAVLTGDLLNRIEYPDRLALLDTYVTQVARKVGGQWKFVSFQITPKPQP